MIINASQRGGAKQLGQHLLKTTENEHVDVHEIRGFMAADVLGALKEAQAIAMGTKCKQHLFSTSLNPPAFAEVSTADFEKAANRIEEVSGLTGHPRIMVFHEKEGRRHAHVVWSRINAEEMKAVQMSHFKRKLHEVTKELYLEHGWEMPEGMRDQKNRDPRSFSLAEWQQAKRIGKNARDLKAAVQDAWNASDNKKAFMRALEERGMFLAKGDRRSHVAVTYEGEVLSVARYASKKAKEVKARLGATDDLRTVAETKAHIASIMTPQMHKFLRDGQAKAERSMQPLQQKRKAMAQAHQKERSSLAAKQQQRWETETRARAAKLRKGFKGLWDRLTGTHGKQQERNEREAYAALERDRRQSHALQQAQRTERQALQQDIQKMRADHVRQQTALYRDLAGYRRMQSRQAETVTPGFNRAVKSPTQQHKRDRGPEIER